MHIDNKALHADVHSYQAKKKNKKMQASLCLRTACPINAKNQHCYVLCRLHDRSQLMLNLPPLSRPRIINLPIRAHMTPPKSNIKKKDEVTRISQLKAAAAAVVMACTIGAMCTNQKAMAASGSPPLSPSPSRTSESDRVPILTSVRTDTQKSSIQALREIFDRKYDFGSRKPVPTPEILFEILSDELQKDKFQKLKIYGKQLEYFEKSEEALNSIFEQWKQSPHNNETYNIGLVLVDLLINLGDYERAASVCQNIESYAPKNAVRPKVRRAILDHMMRLSDAVGSVVKKSKKKRRLKRELNSIVCKIIEIIQENLDYTGKPRMDVLNFDMLQAILDHMMRLSDAVGSVVKNSEEKRRLKRELNSIVCKIIEIIRENLDSPSI